MLRPDGRPPAPISIGTSSRRLSNVYVAPHTGGGKTEASDLMQKLFAEEFKRESAT